MFFCIKTPEYGITEMPTWNNDNKENQAPKKGRKREEIWAPEGRKMA